MARKTTQHSEGILPAKVAQRLACLPPPQDGKRLRVLDAYGGDGDIWRAVRAARGIDDIQVTSIDKTPRQRGQLAIDNLRYLRSADLRRFDVIDLDAWGVPAAQLRTVAESGFMGVIPWTCIVVGMGPAPNDVLRAAGVPRSWTRVAQHLYSTAAPLADLWLNYLHSLGYRSTLVASLNLAGGQRVYGVTGDLSRWSRQRQDIAEEQAVAILSAHRQSP